MDDKLDFRIVVMTVNLPESESVRRRYRIFKMGQKTGSSLRAATKLFFIPETFLKKTETLTKGLTSHDQTREPRISNFLDPKTYFQLFHPEKQSVHLFDENPNFQQYILYT